MRSISLINIYYLALFVLLYFFTLNFNYVEGDDASTVLYHLCGRDSAIQKPYAAYNSGIDFIIQLSGLKTEESIRMFAVFISFISGFLLLVAYKSFLEVFFEDIIEVKQKSRIYFYLLLPFIVPDLLFHSLIINSTNISFVFVMYSLICFIKFLKSNQNYFLVLSSVLFAFAVPFRWTILVSLPVYLGLMFYFSPINYTKTTVMMFLKVALASVFGLILSVFFINLTGYNLQGISETILSTTGYLSKADYSVLSILSTGSAFITPPLLFIVFLSFYRIWVLYGKTPKFVYSLFALILFSISPFFLFGFFPSYKFLITIFPIILIVMVFGFDYIVKKKILLILLIISIFSIWFLGIQINASGTFCGPGFELNTNKIKEINRQKSNDLENVDDRVKINKVAVKFGSGFYMPMLEGPRPLYGYFYVFFKKGWYNQIEGLTKERQKLIKMLLENDDVILFQDRRTAYVSCDLYKNGYKTNTDFIDNKSYLYRNLIKNKDTIVLKVVPDNCSKVEWISNLLVDENKKVIYRSSYSSEILKLYNVKKGNVTIVGPFTAIIH